ncbi:hypothetical protein [Metabacillus fastidiosus]|uniref:hypothetical protein n=1 Tax=Metabacillus fastidiosus TaxID=1458 RepID=UPI003D2927E0
MNFETKYLIRWGIPGWMFIFWLFLYMIFAKYNYITNLLKLNQIDKVIGVFVSFSIIGVVIGYIIHHLYFLVNWVFSKNRSYDYTVEMVEGFEKPENWGENNKVDYFFLESTWHRQLLKIEEESVRSYIEGRYRYLLSTIHGLGTTLLSHILVFAVTLTLSIERFGIVELPWVLIIFNIIQLLIGIVALINFAYYSANLSYFQGYFLNKMINNKLIED